jgi:hypothetical protein
MNSESPADVRFVSIPDSSRTSCEVRKVHRFGLPSKSVSLFDHLGGDGEHPGRHLDEFIISTRIYYRPRCLMPKSALHSRSSSTVSVNR